MEHDVSRTAGARVALDEIEDLNVLIIRLQGSISYANSNLFADTLCGQIHGERRAGVMFDYRGAVMTHTLVEFGRFGDRLATYLPRGVRVAYVYGPQTLTHAAFISKRLMAGGLEAGAFPDEPPARAWFRERLGRCGAA